MRGAFCVKHREQQREKEERAAEPAREIGEHVGGLRAEKIFSHPAAKRRAETFAFRSLHEDDENEQQRHDDKNREQKVD